MTTFRELTKKETLQSNAKDIAIEICENCCDFEDYSIFDNSDIYCFDIETAFNKSDFCDYEDFKMQLEDFAHDNDMEFSVVTHIYFDKVVEEIELFDAEIEWDCLFYITDDCD